MEVPTDNSCCTLVSCTFTYVKTSIRFTNIYLLFNLDYASRISLSGPEILGLRSQVTPDIADSVMVNIKPVPSPRATEFLEVGMVEFTSYYCQ